MATIIDYFSTDGVLIGSHSLPTVYWFALMVSVSFVMLHWYWLVSPQYGGWWTSVRGWDGWAWLSTCCSVPWRHTTSLRSTASVWSLCREEVTTHLLRLPPSAATCHRFLCGCWCWSSCYHTCSSSSSCSHAQEPTPELLDTACFLSALPCFSAVAAMLLNLPITGQRALSSTHKRTTNQRASHVARGGTTAGCNCTNKFVMSLPACLLNTPAVFALSSDWQEVLLPQQPVRTLRQAPPTQERRKLFSSILLLWCYSEPCAVIGRLIVGQVIFISGWSICCCHGYLIFVV